MQPLYENGKIKSAGVILKHISKRINIKQLKMEPIRYFKVETKAAQTKACSKSATDVFRTSEECVSLNG